MIKIIDRLVTGVFVLMFGILWYITKCVVKPNQYKVIIYDILGNQVYLDGIRTNFRTSKVAKNYISEYQKRFSHYDFTLASEMPVIKRNRLLEIFKNS